MEFDRNLYSVKERWDPGELDRALNLYSSKTVARMDADRALDRQRAQEYAAEQRRIRREREEAEEEQRRKEAARRSEVFAAENRWRDYAYRHKRALSPAARRILRRARRSGQAHQYHLLPWDPVKMTRSEAIKEQEEFLRSLVPK